MSKFDASLSSAGVRLLMNFESLPVAHCCPCLSVAAALRPSLCSGAEGRLLHEHFGLAQHGFAQSFGIVHVSGVIPVHPVACKKNKKSALWLALYRLLWCLITLVATRSSFLHFCSMIVAGPAHHGLVMRLRTACCGFCKHSLLRCYSWCMLFGSVSELIVVQCLGCGTDLPLVATPSSSLDRFVFGHRCSMGTLAIHCSGLCKHSCLLQMVHALWKRLRAHRCTVPWVWHGLTFGGDSELCLGQVCLWSRLLNGHPCYLLHVGPLAVSATASGLPAWSSWPFRVPFSAHAGTMPRPPLLPHEWLREPAACRGLPSRDEGRARACSSFPCSAHLPGGLLLLIQSTAPHQSVGLPHAGSLARGGYRWWRQVLMRTPPVPPDAGPACRNANMVLYVST